MSSIERSKGELLTASQAFVDLCKAGTMVAHYLNWRKLYTDLGRAGMDDLADLLWEEQWDEAQDWITSHGPDAWGK